MQSALFFAVGALCFYLISLAIWGSYKKLGEKIIAESENRAREKSYAMRNQELEHQIQLEKDSETARQKLRHEEEKMRAREEKMELRMNLIEKKLSEIDKKEEILSLRKERIEEEKRALYTGQKKLTLDMEKLSGMSSLEAKNFLLERLHKGLKKKRPEKL